MSVRPDLIFEPLHQALQFLPQPLVYAGCVIVILSAVMIAATAFTRLLGIDR